MFVFRSSFNYQYLHSIVLTWLGVHCYDELGKSIAEAKIDILSSGMKVEKKDAMASLVLIREKALSKRVLMESMESIESDCVAAAKVFLYFKDSGVLEPTTYTPEEVGLIHCIFSIHI